MRLRLLVVFALTTALIACNRQVAPQAPTGKEKAEPQGEVAAVRDLQVGDCVNIEGNPLKTNPPQKIDCGDPHDAQVVGTTEYTEKSLRIPGGEGAPYPGAQLLFDENTPECGESLEFYAGKNPNIELDIFVILPSEDEWNGGGHLVACAMIQFEREKLEGDLEGI